jgi:uncharacterized protein
VPVSASLARQLFEVSKPLSPDLHLIASGAAHHLLLPNGTQLFDIDEALFNIFDAARRSDRAEGIADLFKAFGLAVPPLIDDAAPAEPPLRALSLAVAQKCDLGCTYCYAQQGSFGQPARVMPVETALKAVDLLFRDARAGERVNLSFLGGEPLANRRTIRAATERAQEIAHETGAIATFSITTNGTLVTPDDAEFFEAHGFGVTISLDGPRAVHDRLRPFKSGRGSFDRILERIGPLLRLQQQMQVSARVTVTPENLELKETLDAFLDMGFHSVGFSPLLRTPSGRGEMTSEDLEVMLEQMVECGHEFERRVVTDGRYAFTNMVNAMREIHRGTHRPYPCGAGAGYMGVSADGELSACHRFVGDPDGGMGNLTSGVDRRRQTIWLTERHVHRQEPCSQCWARYLCGGGCHHEVIRRGRPACDYIRGWLHYCLSAYGRLRAVHPQYFGPVTA